MVQIVAWLAYLAEVVDVQKLCRVPKPGREVVGHFHDIEGSAVHQGLAELFGELLLPLMLRGNDDEVIVVIRSYALRHVVRDTEIVDSGKSIVGELEGAIVGPSCGIDLESASVVEGMLD